MAKTKLCCVLDKPLDSVYYEYSTHQTTLLEGLNSLRQKGQLLDIILIVEGQIFKAHKAVLSACSDYFRAMFTDAMLESRQTEVILNGVSATGIALLLDYVYTSRLALNSGNIQDVLSAASHVQMSAVVQTCSSYLETEVDLENCVDIVTIAETYSLLDLKRKVYAFMSGHFFEFSSSSEFYRLAPQHLENLLACDFPVDCSEADVLRIVLSWFIHVDNSELDHHLGYALRIFRLIHFNEIPRWKLDTVLEKVFVNRGYEHKLYKLVLSEVYYQSSKFTDFKVATNLLNSRGMEMALLKIGGFGIGGITNEITYCLSSGRKWRHLTTIPHVEQCNFGTAVLNNELYVVGGCFNQSLQENIHPFGFKYSPRYNKWSTMAPMKTERCRFSLNVVGKLLYAIGGSSEVDDLEGATSACECYDPGTDTWKNIKPIPEFRTQHAGATFERHYRKLLFISGGIHRDSVTSSLYCFDTACDTWRVCKSMLNPRADHVMLSIGFKLYVCGGWREDLDTRSRILVDTIDTYDVLKNAWEVVTRIPTPRYHAGIVGVDCKIYFIGGFHSAAMFDKDTPAVECYNIQTDTWTTGDKYPQDVWEHACATLYIPKCRDDMEVLTSNRDNT